MRAACLLLAEGSCGVQTCMMLLTGLYIWESKIDVPWIQEHKKQSP